MAAAKWKLIGCCIADSRLLLLLLHAGTSEHCDRRSHLCVDEFTGTTMGQAALDGSLLFLHSNMHKWDMRQPEKFSLHYQRRWMKMLPGEWLLWHCMLCIPWSFIRLPRCSAHHTDCEVCPHIFLYAAAVGCRRYVGTSVELPACIGCDNICDHHLHVIGIRAFYYVVQLLDAIQLTWQLALHTQEVFRFTIHESPILATTKQVGLLQVSQLEVTGSATTRQPAFAGSHMLTHNYWKPRKSVHLPLGANKRLMGITNLRVEQINSHDIRVTELQEANKLITRLESARVS